MCDSTRISKYLLDILIESLKEDKKTDKDKSIRKKIKVAGKSMRYLKQCRKELSGLYDEMADDEPEKPLLVVDKV